MKRKILTVFLLTVLAAGGMILLLPRHEVRSGGYTESALAAFGGLRSIAAEVIWFRMDRLQDEGRYVELAELAHALTLAEPHTPEVWAYAAWNLAYNVSVMMDRPEDRWRWVKAAIELLRDDGLRLNPDSPDLYRELAWLFELKLGTDLDTAAWYYRKEWAKIAPRGLENPFAAAIHYAELGLRCDPKNGMLKEILRQSKVLYGKSKLPAHR